MITIDIPGGDTFTFRNLVLDYNGTIALDGTLLPGVAERLPQLARQLKVHVITADTHGTVAAMLAQANVHLVIIGAQQQDQEKLAFLESLGPDCTVAIGNGRNDRLMLAVARLGIGLLGQEGMCADLLHQADVLCRSIEEALDLLLKPDRLRATLRN